MRDLTAALIVVGNEILSGKVADSNSTFLARELRQIGVNLRRIVVIPDELDEIAEAVRTLQPTHDVLFTSGGVGPTHDDVTIEGVARGLGRRVVRHPVMEEKLRELFGGRINEARLKMADVPEGGEMVFEGGTSFPTLKVENIYILPGIPELFDAKVVSIKPRFAADPFHLRIVYTNELETTIAPWLNQTLEAFPALLLGSYPKYGDSEYRVRLTLESKDRDYVERALVHLLGLMPAGAVLRTE
jgi:molybdenum cofactor synthesis domain-containing protein